MVSLRVRILLAIPIVIASISLAFQPLPNDSHRQTTGRNHLRESATDDRQQDQKLPLDGAICLVTGASRGIGKGIATELGRQGATVYITGTTSSSNSASSNHPYAVSKETGGPGTIEATAQEITESGGEGIPILCNHAVDDDVRSCVDLIVKNHGRLDVLVNNCFRLPRGGVQELYKPFWEQSADMWDTIHTVGLRSHFVATSMSIPLLQEAKKNPHPNMPRPFIAMVSSFGGLTYTFNVPYGVGKAGVDRLAKDMAVELTPEDICVVPFYPGLVETERTQESVKNGDWDKYVQLPLDKSETPVFTGKAIVATLLDAKNMDKSGKPQIVAELADEYDFDDINGTRPPSIRSLKFLLPTYGFDAETREKVPDWLIPDWKLPLWVMAQGQPPSETE